MPDDPAAAVRALRRQRVDGAFEAVEGVSLVAPVRRHDDLERLVVFVPANLTHASRRSLRLFSRFRRGLFLERSLRFPCHPTHPSWSWQRNRMPNAIYPAWVRTKAR